MEVKASDKTTKMQRNRRKFLKLAGLTGMGVTGVGILNGFASEKNTDNKSEIIF